MKRQKQGRQKYGDTGNILRCKGYTAGLEIYCCLNRTINENLPVMMHAVFECS